MFDIVVASAPGTSFARRIAHALRDARMRVISCEVSPSVPAPNAVRVDVAVACAATGPEMMDVARSLRAVLDGPPPVLGISDGATVTARGELEEALPGDTPGPALAARVQRAAARGERRRSRVVLQGNLDDVGLDSLLASLASRERSCFVRVLSGTRRAAVTLDAGLILHVRADGLDGSTDQAAALVAVAAWPNATFEVVTSDGAAPSRQPRESERPPPSARTTTAADVALAAAVINACAAYVRAFLGAEKSTTLLDASLARARQERPALGAFVVSRDGMVSVTLVERAKAAIPDALASWIVMFFDEAVQADPARFRRVRIREVLGGLTRLVEQVGWSGAVLEGAIRG